MQHARATLTVVFFLYRLPTLLFDRTLPITKAERQMPVQCSNAAPAALETRGHSALHVDERCMSRFGFGCIRGHGVTMANDVSVTWARHFDISRLLRVFFLRPMIERRKESNIIPTDNHNLATPLERCISSLVCSTFFFLFTMSDSSDSMLPSVLGSAAAGVVSRACTHPLDTAKARLQAPVVSGEPIYKGPVDTLWRTFRTEGIRGLYRGFPAVIVGGTPGTMLYLCSYELLKTRFSSIYGGSQDNFALHFSCGMLAETIACIIYVPVDVVKERMQVQHGKTGVYRNSMDAFSKIVRNEGMSGIYKGYAATLASFGPFSALYFMFYERFKHLTRQHLFHTHDGTAAAAAIESIDKMEIPFPYLVVSSCSAGALASWFTSPLDMAKLRLQIQRGKVANQGSKSALVTYRGVVDCLRYAYRDGGVHGLFRGAWARVLHFAPATTITMTCYETFRLYFAKSLSYDNDSSNS